MTGSRSISSSLLPDLDLRRIAVNHTVVYRPTLQPAAPGHDLDLEPVALHIDASRQDHAALRHHPTLVRLPTLVEPLAFRRLAALVVRLGADQVDEGLLALLVALGGNPPLRQPSQVRPLAGKCVDPEAGDAVERR